MINIQEIVERTMYMSLLHTTETMGYTLDPDNYLVDGLPTLETERAFNTDMASISKFIYIFGIGNNQSRGQKECPRISLDLKGFYPGNVGIPQYIIDDSDKTNPIMVEYSSNSTHTIAIDVHLVSNNQMDMRLLHTIMYKALPAMGYIKPYYNDKSEWLNRKISSTDNIFIEVGNYYDHNDSDHGILEKVYTYHITDGMVIEALPDITLVPIHDISLLIQPELSDGIKLHIT